MWFVAGVSLAVGLLTTLLDDQDLGDRPSGPRHPDWIKPRLSDLPMGDRMALMLPIVALAALTCIIGLFPEFLRAVRRTGGHAAA